MSSPNPGIPARIRPHSGPAPEIANPAATAATPTAIAPPPSPWVTRAMKPPGSSRGTIPNSSGASPNQRSPRVGPRARRPYAAPSSAPIRAPGRRIAPKVPHQSTWDREPASSAM
ncbi:hypothetical protein [Nocardiopsis protaetiae]|uniref:hypothetical protein n=1 Tax=Nocardiopsis protaetiae TaxID=3382270 RepID=UPI00387AF8C0